MSNLQTYHHVKLDFQKVNQHTGCKWLIHGTKRRKDNQLQSLELTCRISQRAHTCTENVLKTRFQDVQNVDSEDVHKT